MIPPPAGGSRRTGLALVAIAQLVFFGISFHNFLGADNLTTTAQNSTDVLIASIGTAALVISGNVDLSIGSQYALVAVVTADVANHAPAGVVVLAALAVGLLLGTINGLLVVRLSISPLIVTLATLALYQGLAAAICDGNPVVLVGARGFTDIGQSHLLGIPTPVLIGLAVFAIGGWILATTVTGLRLYAVGGNREAASLVGLPVDRLIVGTYAANGAVIGVVGMLITSQLGSGSPLFGDNFEVEVLTAVILGGVAFSGGFGSPIGVFVGVATLAILDSGLIFEGLADWYQQLSRGALLILALAADQLILGWRRGRLVRPDSASAPVASQPPEPPGPATPRTGTVGEPLLVVAGVSVRYSGSLAVEGIDLVVNAGEVVCLVGDNGAGKSTLVKAITGVVHPSSGQITLGGDPLPSTPALARHAGIEPVFQNLALFGNLSVANNIGIGLEARRRIFGPLAVRDYRAAERIATERLRSLGSSLTPDRTVDELSGGQRQAVAIARVLRENVRLVILDEPTAALGARQTAEVLRLVRAAAAAGRGVLLITHDIEDVFDVGDNAVVLGHGRVIAQGPVAEMDRLELVRTMSGR
jgi:ribose/xylose/arabinose/galactoside ABC-type transport system permease subunit/ABC-type branched-subunit amino acid transport system ATPase component